MSLLGFCDASTSGYASCAYVRITTNNVSTVFLLKAKTRLSPLKTISIPRLELCAAQLLCRLLKSLKSFVDRFAIEDIWLFSDSTVVLSWICSGPHMLKTFVANRVSFIQQSTKPEQWFHVGTSHNPADFASRGLKPESMLGCALWWNGPPWLLFPPNDWPVRPAKEFACSQPPECKDKPLVLHIRSHVPTFFSTWITTFSSYSRLQRSFAFVLRFVRNSRLPLDQRQLGPLTSSELQHATKTLVKLTQQKLFTEEFCSLQRDIAPVSLAHLSPFIDDDGIVRVGGRLQNSSLSESAKHPMLLPSGSHLSHLLIDYYHKCYLHAGPQLLQSLLFQQFWIISARRVIRKRLSRCMTCYRLKAKPASNIMGNLPASRTTSIRSFASVGVDFAGPFLIKESSRRNAPVTKAYLCLFVCMTTKALHLEAVSGLSTEAFLSSLDRFVSRRGLPADIYSDCGTNFVGASRELTRLLASPAGTAQISDHLASKGVNWHFNPPLAPHFGGLWEAGVKSSKGLLKRIAGDRPFTFEELTTLFCRIEAILNSRPLCPLSASPDDLSVLTPGHFLIGAPLVSLPEPTLIDRKECSLSRWQLVNQATQHFWSRFNKEYLHLLQQRSKWTSQSNNVKVGDVVLLIEPLSPPLSWKVARITEVHPGLDGVVRVVTIKTSLGTYKRPIAKVALLPPVD